MTAKTTRLAGYTVAGLLALGAGMFMAMRTDLSMAPQADAKAGATLLAVTLPDVDGTMQPLAQWRGKVLVVNFWATWCAPCREEMPEFIKAQAKYGGKGLQFVGIAVDDVGKVRQFANELGLNYPALVGGYGAMELSGTLGNKLMALPFTVVLGRDGKIAHTQLGPLKPEKLDSIISQLI